MQIAYFNTLKEMKHQRTTCATNSFMIYNVHNAYLGCLIWETWAKWQQWKKFDFEKI